MSDAVYSLSPQFACRKKTAMVTGSSSGIGKTIAVRLAEQGWSVILHGRTESPQLLATKEEIESFGGVTKLLTCDFYLSDQLESFVDSAWNLLGGIDAWINNAGGDVLTGKWIESKLIDKLNYLLTVDVTATLLLSRAVGQKMKSRYEAEIYDLEQYDSTALNGSYSILNMGWDQANHGMGGESGELFATTKGAIMAMTRSLAQSLAPCVRVNCLAPGWIQTAWGDQTSAYWDQRAKRESLMNRWGNGDDVAHAASFLCSDQARFISGHVLPINGGYRYSFE